MSNALESTVIYLNTKVDFYEEKFFSLKKDDDKTFVSESISFYRAEAAKVRSQLLDLDDLEGHPLSQTILKFANEEMMPDHMRDEAVNQ